MSESVIATAYPQEREYEEWVDEAESMGMSVSEYIQAMTRAGRKNFAIDVEPDEDKQDLREARDYYRQEVEKLRRKVESLEAQVHGGEVSAIESYVQANPGANPHEIISYVQQTASKRVSDHLDSMAGRQLRNEDGAYYPIENNEGGGD